jgi:hypothetical protein
MGGRWCGGVGRNLQSGVTTGKIPLFRFLLLKGRENEKNSIVFGAEDAKFCNG